MADHARNERHALCDTLERVGPQAPTLCDPWSAADLAAHLVVRERRLDAALGVVLPALASHTESVMASYAGRPWPELVDLVRGGPPRWSPTSLGPVDEATNLAEFVIHHEDLLRTGPGGEEPGPHRELDPEVSDTLWHNLVRLSPLMFRKSPSGVVLRTPRARTAARSPRSGHGTVVIAGEPVELLLTAFGRVRVAQVEVTGADADLEALFGAPLGLGG